MRKLKYLAYFLLSVVAALLLYMKISGSTFGEVQLALVNWLKKIEVTAVELEELPDDERLPISHAAWTELLSAHVSATGQVDYPGFMDNQAALDAYLELLTQNPPGSNWSGAEKMAYWINAYNAFTVKLIINHYPLASIRDIGGGGLVASPWDLKFFQIGGLDFDLTTIENEILRKDFAEPRIHFAINCASISCPQLRMEAYEAERLDAQLDEQARQFLRDPLKNKITENSSKISRIFSWFQSDFTQEMDLKSYLRQYVPDLNETNSITYLSYDWGLNE